ncbi:Hypothetical predicted protein [Mytilus galloprovincialis]|uniref:Exonuclease domain-containing protein n=1 Tax=Mytilus galloprovincialis TaxID=29158 RepID=A0A8B6H7N7_MYTGA|nr:Hypothetical predicted protein [Mytilus galloprovincialis]
MSDRNHVKKNIANSLYSLGQKHKKLNQKIIKYFLNCLNYMLCQNQNDPDGVENGLEAVGRHPFGDHTFCDKTWCSHVEDPSKKYASLPFGKPLKDIPLQTALMDLMKGYKTQSSKLSNLGSTQGNESFNKSVASKAPKAHFYSGSSSLNIRVAASVAQKNEGQSYLLKVNKKIGLSPGVHTKRLAILRDIQARKRKAISVTRKEKIRRIQLRNRRIKKNTVKELCEGLSYSSAIDLQDHQDITEIPSAPSPPIENCHIQETAKLVCFDFETTSLARDSHITQIAAVSGDNHWSCYVTPKIPITNQASDITGITVRNGRVFHQGKPVDSLSISKAMEDFFKFIKGEDLKSFSQINLLKTLLNCDYAAHDALQDVTFLQKLMESSKIDFTDAKFSSATFTVPAAFHSFDQSASCKLNLPSLLEFVDNKVLSIGMARKIAASNLNKASLLIAFSRGQENGLQQLFSEECGKGPRVTKSSKIIHAVSKYISEHLIES